MPQLMPEKLEKFNDDIMFHWAMSTQKWSKENCYSEQSLIISQAPTTKYIFDCKTAKIVFLLPVKDTKVLAGTEAAGPWHFSVARTWSKTSPNANATKLTSSDCNTCWDSDFAALLQELNPRLSAIMKTHLLHLFYHNLDRSHRRVGLARHFREIVNIIENNTHFRRTNDKSEGNHNNNQVCHSVYSI